MSQSSETKETPVFEPYIDDATATAKRTATRRGRSVIGKRRQASGRFVQNVRSADVTMQFIGIDVHAQSELVSKIRKGLPIRVFERLAETLEISEKDLAMYTSLPPRTLARRKTIGQLQPNESDRLSRIAILLEKAIGLFEGDRETAVKWLKTPKRALAGATPIEYSDTEPGVQEVIQLIGRLEHGIIS